MSALNSAIVKMLQTLKLMVAANLSKYTVIPAFEATFTEVTDLLTEIETEDETAVDSTKPTTGAKNTAYEALVVATLEVAAPVLAYAGKVKNTAMQMQMDLKPYMFDKMYGQNLISTCQNIYNAADSVKDAAKPYNLTQERLDKLQAAITAYSTLQPKVRQVLGEINTSKRDISRLVSDALDILETQLDPMVRSLQYTNPTAVELWDSARHVVKPQRTPTQLKAKVFGDEEMLLPDTKVFAINGKTYPATTDADGQAHWKKLPYGVYNISCDAPGYKPFFLKEFKVVRGRINHVEVKLEKLG